MLETQAVSINFGQGVDTKTDPKLVIAGKLVSLQDAVFTNAKRLTKRNGYDALTLNKVGGGTLSAPTMVKSYKSELVCSDSGRLYSLSTSLNAWKDVGKYNSVEVTKQIISAPEFGGIPTGLNTAGVTNTNCALLGNIALYTYDQGFANNSFGAYFTVVDVSTGMHIADRVSITCDIGGTGNGTVKGYSRAIVLGGTTLAILYIGDSTGGGDPTASAKLCLRTVTVSSGGVVVGSEVIIGGSLSNNASSVFPTFYHSYDAVPTATGAVIALPNQPALNLYTIDTSGSTTHTATIATGSTYISPVNITLDVAGTNAWIYYVTTDLKYAIYSVSTLSQVLAPTTAQASVSAIQNIVGLPVTSTSQSIYVSTYLQPAVALTIGVITPKISLQTVNLGGSVGSVSTFLNDLDIYGRPFTVSGKTYLPVNSMSQTKSTGFIVDLADGLPVAKFLPGAAEGVYSAGYNTTGTTYQAPTILCVRLPGFPVSVLSLNSTKVFFPATTSTEIIPVVISSSTAGAAYPSTVTNGASMAAASVTLDFNSADAFQSVVQQDTLVLNGGIVCQYDGASVTELGFSIEPDNVSAIVAAGSGSIGAGKFTYYVVFRWVDANGNLHQSAPSDPVTVVTSGASNTVELSFSSLVLSQKTNATFAVYRTIANGTIAYLVNTGNITSLSYRTFNDQNADDTIKVKETLYTEAGAILDNIAPPPAMILWVNNNRVWCVDSENPKTTIEYSKTASQGSGISFSTGLLEYVIDSRLGEITGAQPMDEKTVLIKENGIGYFIGDGANDSGTGSTLSNFQFTPSDVGGSNSKAVAIIPAGVIFRANKGIYLLSRGLQLAYFGVDVESYNSQDVQAIEVLNNNTQVRFLTSSGSSLVYDSLMNQWGTFSNHTGLSSTLWGGVYVYVRTDGKIYKENTTTFLDAGVSFAPVATLAWIKAGSVQNLERVKEALLLGDSQGAAGHGVQVSFAYDFGSTFTSVLPYSFTSAGVAPYQMRAFLPQQKCDAVQIKIQEITTGASGEFIDFSDLALIIGIKRGLNKLPAAQSVG